MLRVGPPVKEDVQATDGCKASPTKTSWLHMRDNVFIRQLFTPSHIVSSLKRSALSRTPRARLSCRTPSIAPSTKSSLPFPPGAACPFKPFYKPGEDRKANPRKSRSIATKSSSALKGHPGDLMHHVIYRTPRAMGTQILEPACTCRPVSNNSARSCESARAKLIGINSKHNYSM